jgi:asparagine N-glycosylation enzyme membrane subunit Stt3
MLERIGKNPKTSLLGGILFVSALLLVWFQKATLAEAAVFLPAIVGLLWAKD